MKFEEAMEAIKQDKIIRRKCWDIEMCLYKKDDKLVYPDGKAFVFDLKKYDADDWEVVEPKFEKLGWSLPEDNIMCKVYLNKKEILVLDKVLTRINNQYDIFRTIIDYIPLIAIVGTMGIIKGIIFNNKMRLE
jgi:hypothetical protein